MERINIDDKIYDLYDEYCHGFMSRRDFLSRASAITVAGISGLAMAQALLPRYAEAQTISFTDNRIKANCVEYLSPGGTTGDMRGYLVRPTAEGPFPSLIIIHENRGLNPHSLHRILLYSLFIPVNPGAGCFADIRHSALDLKWLPEHGIPPVGILKPMGG